MNELIQQARELCKGANTEKAKGNSIDCAALSWEIVKNIVPQLCDALEEEISRRYQAECNYDHWKAQAEKAEAERDTYKAALEALHIPVETPKGE